MSRQQQHYDPVTDDLSAFGYREIEIAGKLLLAYARDHPDYLGNKVKVWFNRNSGYVFLSGEDLEVAVLNNKGDGLEHFVSCGKCGHEGILPHFEKETKDEKTVFKCPDCGNAVWEE